MNNYIFRLKTENYGGCVANDLLLIKAGSQDDANRAARITPFSWMGVPVGYDMKHPVTWGYNTESSGEDVEAVPACMGIFSNAELVVIRRAVKLYPGQANFSDVHIIACLQDQINDGMPMPGADILAYLFDDAFAARALVELQECE